MSCDGMQRNAQERREYEAAIEELAAQIADGSVQVKKNPFTGRVSVSGWNGTRAAKAGWCEGCALASLKEKGLLNAAARKLFQQMQNNHQRLHGHVHVGRSHRR